MSFADAAGAKLKLRLRAKDDYFEVLVTHVDGKRRRSGVLAAGEAEAAVRIAFADQVRAAQAKGWQRSFGRAGNALTEIPAARTATPGRRSAA